eukprot:COSAG01_NODE_4254_length_5205_cov_3.427145_6_plen_202_part_00
MPPTTNTTSRGPRARPDVVPRHDLAPAPPARCRCDSSPPPVKGGGGSRGSSTYGHALHAAGHGSYGCGRRGQWRRAHPRAGDSADSGSVSVQQRKRSRLAAARHGLGRHEIDHVHSHLSSSLCLPFSPSMASLTAQCSNGRNLDVTSVTLPVQHGHTGRAGCQLGEGRCQVTHQALVVSVGRGGTSCHSSAAHSPPLAKSS